MADLAGHYRGDSNWAMATHEWVRDLQSAYGGTFKARDDGPSPYMLATKKRAGEADMATGESITVKGWHGTLACRS